MRARFSFLNPQVGFQLPTSKGLFKMFVKKVAMHLGLMNFKGYEILVLFTLA